MRTFQCRGCGNAIALPPDAIEGKTVRCGACGREERTELAFGEAVLNAEAYRRSLGQSGAEPPELAVGLAPDRQGTCLRCRAPVVIPLDLRQHTVHCAQCGSTQPVAAHLSDAERMNAHQAHQQAANAALASIRRQGLVCPNCGQPQPGGVEGLQATCRACGSTLLLRGVVDEGALAREHLGAGILAHVDQVVAAQAERDRRLRWAILGAVTFVLSGLFCAALGSSLLGAWAALG